MTIDKHKKVQENLQQEDVELVINKQPSYEDILSEIKGLLMEKAAIYRIPIGQVSIDWSKTLEKLIEKEVELNDKLLLLQTKLIK